MNDKDREVIPFNKLCEFIKWKKNNCDSCKKYEDKSISEEKAKCKPAFYLDLSRHLGTMPLDMAIKIGCSYSFHTPNAELFDKCSKYLSKQSAMNYEDLVSLIKNKRKKDLKVPQSRIAEELGISLRTYNNFETRQKTPSGRSLLKILDLFGIGLIDKSNNKVLTKK